VANSLNGQGPDRITSVDATLAEIVWEGNSVIGDVGGQFNTHINADRAPELQRAQAGTATITIFVVPPPASPRGTKAYHIYSIFNGSGRVLYNDPNLGDYHSLFWSTNVYFLFQVHALMVDR
jgi:hypothetical protein